mgnify:FL=1
MATMPSMCTKYASRIDADCCLLLLPLLYLTPPRSLAPGWRHYRPYCWRDGWPALLDHHRAARLPRDWLQPPRWRHGQLDVVGWLPHPVQVARSAASRRTVVDHRPCGRDPRQRRYVHGAAERQRWCSHRYLRHRPPQLGHQLGCRQYVVVSRRIASHRSLTHSLVPHRTAAVANFATCQLAPTSHCPGCSGTVWLQQAADSNEIRVRAKVSGLQYGSQHGFHIHTVCRRIDE